jgi:hypothetical protein
MKPDFSARAMVGEGSMQHRLIATKRATFLTCSTDSRAIICKM